MVFDELKKKYDSLEITEIESEMERHGRFSIQHRKEFIFGLYYLERTKRYRESGRFKAASFDVYLRSVFNLSIQKYEEERKAFIVYPEESQKHGVGIVVNIIKKCGALKAESAIKAIGKARQATPEIVKQVIAQYAPHPSKPKESAKMVTVHELQAIIKAKDAIIQEQNNVIREQAEQIMKLKGALVKAHEQEIAYA
jgi:hypothetical protein